jgi:2'-5' RNA ligase
MPTVRLFIAIDLSEELRASLRRLQGNLRDRMAPRSVRWVQVEGIHLTLKFLGDTPLDKVDKVKTALAQAAAQASPFVFTVEGLGCFPSSHRPRVVWVGLQEPSGTLTQLRDAVEAHVAPLGFPTEKRPFHPHLTLGRVHRRASKSEVREIGEVVATAAVGNMGKLAVSSVSLIKSDLQPSGAVYTKLLEVGLGAD